MANVPIPPLLCSTPPPIDFGEEEDEDSGLPPTLEDDDEFGEFTLASSMNVNKNNDVPSLPPTPTPQELSEPLGFEHITGTSPPPLEIEETVKEDRLNLQPLEAFNLNVSTNFTSMEPEALTTNDAYTEKDSDFSEAENSTGVDVDSSSSSPSTSNMETADCQSDVKSCSEISGTKEKDAVVETERSLSKVSENESKNVLYVPPVRSDLIKMEDLSDDSSDDECRSPKNTFAFADDENSTDFFAIHMINEAKELDSKSPSENTNTNAECEDSDEFDDFAAFAEVEPTNMEHKTEIHAKILQDTGTEENQCIIAEDSATQSIVAHREEMIAVDKGGKKEMKTVEADFDDFADFQNFDVPPTTTPSIANSTVTKSCDSESVVESTLAQTAVVEDANDVNDDDFDDDFGDFSEATFTTAIPAIPAQKEPSTIVPTIQSIQLESPSMNTDALSKRLQNVLEIMFPISSNENSLSACAKIKEKLNTTLNSVDAAKALEFQWGNSKLRHALIKSLGIDSRNILFGEKWNSSMPRFAANLGMSPLQPMKQQPNSTDTGTAKSEIPAVEFDWGTSGLVNPLDGSASVLQARETQASGRIKSAELHASTDTALPASSQLQLQQQQQQQHEMSNYDVDVDLEIEVDATATTDADANANTVAGVDTATTSATIADTTTTAISPNVSPNSIGNRLDHTGHYLDLETSTKDSINTTFGVEAPGIEAVTDAAVMATTTATASNVLNSFGIRGSILPMGLDVTNTTQDNDNENEVVATSTYAGPLKETHIYTPSKGDNADLRTATATTITGTKLVTVDFDYEKAAAGIIIDETVVKKEYRDLEYNPGFDLRLNTDDGGQMTASKTVPLSKLQSLEITEFFSGDSVTERTRESKRSFTEDVDDEFSDFQSVPPPVHAVNGKSACSLPSSPFNSSANVSALGIKNKNKERERERDRASATLTPTIADEMILSPAILLPQAISMNSNKPKIEWGDAATNINPEELARIEELFPQPKSVKAAKEVKENSQHVTPTRKEPALKLNSLSISASIAHKEQHAGNEDDDWSEFVSVPINTNAEKTNSKINNNHLLSTTSHYQTTNLSLQYQQQHRAQQQQQPSTIGNNCNEEEWSDFVSNAAVANANTHMRGATGVPQFNSGAWQNANCYNNPLSLYHQQLQQQQPANFVNANSPRKLQQHYQQQQQQQLHNNNSSYNNNNVLHYTHNYQQQRQQQLHHQQQQQQQQQLRLQSQPQPQSQQQQQQIHVMQDFSTAPPYRPHVGRTAIPTSGAATIHHFSQFQVGSAKVAPSISLIPDLGFVAPAVATHTTIINSLPLPGFGSTKK